MPLRLMGAAMRVCICSCCCPSLTSALPPLLLQLLPVVVELLLASYTGGPCTCVMRTWKQHRQQTYQDKAVSSACMALRCTTSGGISQQLSCKPCCPH